MAGITHSWIRDVMSRFGPLPAGDFGFDVILGKLYAGFGNRNVRVLTESDKVAFHARMSSDQSISYATLSALNFDTTVIDDCSGFNATTKSFTPPNGQRMILHCYIVLNKPTIASELRVQIAKNGSPLLADFEWCDPAITLRAISVTSPIIIGNGTDSYSAKVIHFDTTSATLYSISSFFIGYSV